MLLRHDIPIDTWCFSHLGGVAAAAASGAETKVQRANCLFGKDGLNVGETIIIRILILVQSDSRGS